MAKVTSAEKHGSVGPSTFQRSRHGLIERQRVRPIDPKTPAQLTHRGILMGASNQWGQLTDEERAGWKSLAGKLAGNLHGQNVHNRLNVIRAKCAQDLLRAAPPLPAFGQLSCAGLLATATPRVQLAQLRVGGGADALIVEACRPVSAGRHCVENLFRYLLVVAAPGDGPVDLDLTAAYCAQYGNPNPAVRLFVQVSAVKNGFRDTPVRFSALVEGKKP